MKNSSGDGTTCAGLPGSEARQVLGAEMIRKDIACRRSQHAELQETLTPVCIRHREGREAENDTAQAYRSGAGVARHLRHCRTTAAGWRAGYDGCRRHYVPCIARRRRSSSPI